ncbi:MAG: MMPL family transporter [Gorillibacterium sp.]|nr:MMPL family transporter [Gorillibacterium sp.]
MRSTWLDWIVKVVAGPKSKWITLLVWIALTACLTMLLPAVGDEENNGAANLGANRPSVQAQELAAREFPGQEGIPALVVWHQEGGLSEQSLNNIRKLTETLTTTPLPNQAFVPPYFQLPLPALLSSLSEDQSTLVMPVLFHNGTEEDWLQTNVEKLKQVTTTLFGSNPYDVKIKDTSMLSARVTGPAGIAIDAADLFKNADVALLLGTVLLVLVLLLLIYRSPVLALIPLVAVGFAYGVVSPILGFIASRGWITVDSQAISIMTVLLFGAGTDYCLFLIARYRKLLTEESDRGVALKRSIEDSAGAIAMSGITVVLALLALLLAEYGSYHRFAIPFSLAILIMGVASLTLVPALLAILGRVSFFPFVPRTPKMILERAERKGKKPPIAKPTERYGRWNGDVVTRRPWTVALLTFFLLAGLAVGSSGVKVTYDLLSSFPKDIPSREGFTLLADKFEPGSLAPIQVMVDTKGKTHHVSEALSTLPFTGELSQPVKGKVNGDIQAYELKLKINPYSNEAVNTIPIIRQAAIDALTKAGIESPEHKVWVGGQTSDQYDTREVSKQDTLTIIPVVIGLIALLLLAYLRSLVAMAYLVLTVVLSFFSALGLGWLILHYGFGVESISGAIPLYSFVFLVALGEDYNIFMISSIWKKVKEGLPFKDAVSQGVTRTGAVITSAGIILAGTFAVLTTLPIQVLVHFGLITAIGVLLDTFLVRPFLVPAITVLLGKHAFWPGKLETQTVSGKQRQES